MEGRLNEQLGHILSEGTTPHARKGGAPRRFAAWSARALPTSDQRRRMILSTSSGDFPIPAEVARRLPNVPALPDPAATDARLQIEDFRHWLDASPEHAIDYERLRRWHLVQEELAAQAKAENRAFVVSDDGLE